MWYAGIDWADTHHDVVVIDEAGKKHGSRRVLHSAEGLAELVAYLKAVGDVATTPEHLACVIETKQGLLITALLEARLPVYPVNPKTLERMRKPSGAKTDAIDAYLLARKGRSDLETLVRLQPDSPLIAELKQLTRDQDGLIQTQTRLVNQLTAALKAYFPVALDLFGKIQQPITIRFLQRFPTLEDAQATSQEDLATFLQEQHYARADQKSRQIWNQLHQPQMHADAITVRIKARLLNVLLGQLLPVMDGIAAYDEEIEHLFVQHPDSLIFASLPRAGKRLAPRLLAEWGDDHTRYADAASVQALAGTAPVTRQSGNYCTAHCRLSCLKPLRNALHQFAWQSTQCEEWASAYYKKKRAEGKTHTVAVRSLAHIWARILYAMWVKRESYQSTVFMTARQAHQRAA